MSGSLNVANLLPILNLCLVLLTIVEGLYLFFLVPERRIKIVGLVSAVNAGILTYIIILGFFPGTQAATYHEPIYTAVLLFTVQLCLLVFIAVSRSAFNIKTTDAIRDRLGARKRDE